MWVLSYFHIYFVLESILTTAELITALSQIVCNVRDITYQIENILRMMACP